LLRTGQPHLGKTVFQQQLQQQLGVPAVGLLFPHLQGAYLTGIPHAQFMAQLGQQLLQPKGVAASFQAYYHASLQTAVKLDCFSALQSPFRMLAGFRIDHSNLLKTRMEITAYNLHDGSFRPSLGLGKSSSLLGALGAVVVMKSSEGACPSRRTPTAHNPNDPRQGILEILLRLTRAQSLPGKTLIGRCDEL